MIEYPDALKELITALRQLPSIGARSAERLALFLLNADPAIPRRLSLALKHASEQMKPCSQCGFFTDTDLCAICRDLRRDKDLWCLVEHPGDVIKFERAGTFRGLYHVLGGRLSPLEGVGPEQLHIPSLMERITQHPPREIILALSADVEGETTTLYLAPLLKERGVCVTRLATGLPAGSGLEFADSVTLGYALNGRREM